MKTLDEPYMTLNELIVYLEKITLPMTHEAVKTDCIHYLKEYQGLSKMRNDKFDKEQENPPLTWEQLKQMEGKPVWVEYEEDKYMYKEWTIITDIFDTDNCKGIKAVRIDSDRYPVPIYLWRRRTAWQAYRNEKE